MTSVVWGSLGVHRIAKSGNVLSWDALLVQRVVNVTDQTVLKHRRFGSDNHL